MLIMGREPIIPDVNSVKCITTIIFKVRSVPAALYKALGGFATNGINLTKLESYMIGGSFAAAQFYVDADGHPDEPAMKLALEELFAKSISPMILVGGSSWCEEAKKNIVAEPRIFCSIGLPYGAPGGALGPSR